MHKLKNLFKNRYYDFVGVVYVTILVIAVIAYKYLVINNG